MKKNPANLFSFSLLTLAIVTAGIFLALPQGANAAVCCGFESSVRPPIDEDACKRLVNCVPVSNAQECTTQQPTWTYYTDEEENVREQLKKIGCGQQKSGLVANLSPGCTSYGNCSVCDFVKVFTNVARMILGFAGAFALLFFILGGFMMVTSYGNTERVDKGRKILASTLVGILIVLAAWQAIRLTILILTKPADLKDGVIKIFTNSNYSPCTDAEIGKKKENPPANPPAPTPKK